MLRSVSRGVTIVELLVVIAIVGLLVALLLPAVQSARSAARRIACANHVRQIGLAFHNYEAAKGVFPPSSSSDIGTWGSAGRKPNHSWASLILPYLEEQNLADRIDFEQPSIEQIEVASTILSIYRCPEYVGPDFSEGWSYEIDGTYPYALGNYVALGATDVGHLIGHGAIGKPRLDPDGSIFPESKTTPKQIRDGLSHSLFVAESREHVLRTWIDGRTAANTAAYYEMSNRPTFRGYKIALNYAPYYGSAGIRSEYGPSSMHPGGGFHLFADGSTRFLRDETDFAVYVAMTTRAGGELSD